jgi:hypothetical protein
VTTIDWKPMAEFVKNNTDYPNRLIFLKVKNAESLALYDVKPEESFITMGHWYPESDSDPGQWICVGWNWDHDEFCNCEEFEPEAWAEIP